MMKKNLLFTLLALAPITMSAAQTPKTTEKNVLSTCANYMFDNRVKCAITAIVLYDLYLHGVSKSIPTQTADCIQNCGIQLYNNAGQAYSTVENSVQQTYNTTCAVGKYITNLVA